MPREESPALYDTSISTGDSHSPPGYFFKSHPSKNNTYARDSLVSATKQQPRSGGRRYASEAVWHEEERHAEDKHPWKKDRVAQSEPGTPQQRFNAYVNRFASMDPRMDHRASERRSSRLVMAANSNQPRRARRGSTPEAESEDHRPRTVTPTDSDYRDRVEIETPQPVRVKDIREKLWDPNEELQVNVQPSWRANEHDDDDHHYRPSPRPSRSRYRSVSPQRVYQHFSQQKEQLQQQQSHESGSDDSSGQRFKSKYYQAAAQQEQRRRQRSKSPKNPAVASLLAKISAVQRDDPNRALAQIDAILQQESEDSTVQELGGSKEGSGAAAPAVETKDNDDDEASATSDDTSVSSITNPTYQEQLQQQEAAAIKVKYAGVSSRSRKPSVLGSYQQKPSQTSFAQQLAEHKERTRSRRLGASPPPATIRLVEEKKEPNTPPRASPTLDPSNSSELAEKIKRWDELSTHEVTSANGGSGSKKSSGTTELGSLVSTSTSPGVRRGHPWDGNVPAHTVQVDATNEAAMHSRGRPEAVFHPRYQTEGADNLPVTRASNRGLRNYHTMDGPQLSNEQYEDAHGDNRILDGDSFSVDPKLMTKSSGWSVTQMTPKQQEHARRMADAFDSAWVDLPENSYFSPSVQDRDNMASRGGEGYRPPSRGPSGEKGDHMDSRRDYQSFSPTESSRGSYNPSAQHVLQGNESQSKLAHDQAALSDSGSRSRKSGDSGVEVALVKSDGKPVQRRGLRGLLQKRRGKTSSAVVIDHTAPSGPLLNSMQLESEMPPPNSRDRRRAMTSRSPRRERSRSLEDPRVRNPNIAQKFSRLLRVYDNERKTKSPYV